MLRTDWMRFCDEEPHSMVCHNPRCKQSSASGTMKVVNVRSVVIYDTRDLAVRHMRGSSPKDVLVGELYGTRIVGFHKVLWSSVYRESFPWKSKTNCVFSGTPFRTNTIDCRTSVLPVLERLAMRRRREWRVLSAHPFPMTYLDAAGVGESSSQCPGPIAFVPLVTGKKPCR